jgi:hypothetical protein
MTRTYDLPSLTIVGDALREVQFQGFQQKSGSQTDGQGCGNFYCFGEVDD